MTESSSVKKGSVTSISTYSGSSNELKARRSIDKNMVVLNSGTEDEIEVWGYKRNTAKELLTLAVVICSFGLVGLFLYWVEHYRLYCTSSLCSLRDASSILIVVSVFILHINIYATLYKKICFSRVQVEKADQN